VGRVVEEVVLQEEAVVLVLREVEVEVEQPQVVVVVEREQQQAEEADLLVEQEVERKEPLAEVEEVLQPEVQYRI
jgi:hypothetical protein